MIAILLIGVLTWDIALDGQRFPIRVAPADSPEPLRVTRIDVILDWHEELGRLAPADRARR